MKLQGVKFFLPLLADFVGAAASMSCVTALRALRRLAASVASSSDVDSAFDVVEEDEVTGGLLLWFFFFAFPSFSFVGVFTALLPLGWAGGG